MRWRTGASVPVPLSWQQNLMMHWHLVVTVFEVCARTDGSESWLILGCHWQMGKLVADAAKSRDTSSLRKLPVHARPLLAFDDLTKHAGDLMAKSNAFPISGPLYGELMKSAGLSMLCWENMVRTSS